jgi:uncharacterized protein (DUF924 family)
MRTADDVLRFWFVEHGKDDWFGGKAEFDAELAKEFAETHAAVARAEAWDWRSTPKGRLAEIIVLDQFSRQLHRGEADAFAQDKMATALTQEAIAVGADQEIPIDRRMFLFMPFQHSESLVIQEQGVRYFEQFGPYMLKFMTDHRDCIAKFGRFPFRNQALGRESTEAEIAYTAEQGARVF